MAGKPRTINAYCYASGHIEFGAVVPRGGLIICKGPPGKVREHLDGVARHGWGDDKPLLVPGIPEAANQSEALDALKRFTLWAAKSAPEGVEFIHSDHTPGPAPDPAKQIEAAIARGKAADPKPEPKPGE